MIYTDAEKKVNKEALFLYTFRQFLKYYRIIDKLNGDKWFEDALSNFLLILLFSIMEGVMQEDKFIGCIPFLDQKSSKLKKGEIVCNEKILDNIIDEYRDNYGAIKNVKRFFDSYVSEEDKIYILKTYKNGRFSSFTIDKVIDDMYTMRSGFVHSLGMESLKPRGEIEVIKYSEELGQHFAMETILNIHDMTNIVWTGVMRKYGFNYALK